MNTFSRGPVSMDQPCEYRSEAIQALHSVILTGEIGCPWMEDGNEQDIENVVAQLVRSIVPFSLKEECKFRREAFREAAEGFHCYI